MKALVLSAGSGSRIRPLSDSCPAVLLSVVGIELLADTLYQLANSGITGVVVTGSRCCGQVEDLSTRICSDLGLDQEFVHETESLGTAGAVRESAHLLGDPFVVAYGNAVSRQPLQDLLDFHESSGSVLTLSLSPTADTSSSTVVLTGPDGMVTGVRRNPPPDGSRTNLAFSGLLVCSQRALDHPGAPGPDLSEHLLPGLLEAGARVAADTPGGYCRRVATPENLLLACYDALSGRIDPWFGPPLSGEGRITGGSVNPGAEVRGVLWTLPGSLVESGSFLENCVVMEGAVVETGARLRYTLVLPGTRVRSGTCSDDKYLCVLGR